MFNTKALMSSNRIDWKTPRDLYNSLNRIFNFNFDPCPSYPKFDGLSIDWKKSTYVNPPYGKEIGKWIKKGFIESQKGKNIVMLIPSRTDTKYWHEYVMKAKEIWFIKGRLRFNDQNNPAPFPSAIILFKKKEEGAARPVIKSVDVLARNL